MTYAMSFSKSQSNVEVVDLSETTNAPAIDVQHLAQANRKYTPPYLCYDWATIKNHALTACMFEGHRDFDMEKDRRRGKEYLFRMANANGYDGYVAYDGRDKSLKDSAWF